MKISPLKNLASFLASSLIAVTITATPAAALDPTLLHPDANGTNGNPGLKVVACPNTLQVFNPSPIDPDGYSTRDALYDDITFEIYDGATQLGEFNEYGNTVSNQVYVVEPNNEGDWSVGETVTFTLKATASGRAATSINFSTEIIDPSFDDGSGTVEDPYLISNAADFSKMRCYEDSNFKLVDDINFPADWIPVSAPGEYDYWAGSLDGNGHKITGLRLTNIANEKFGIFTSVEHGFVQDLEIINPVVYGSQNLGVLAAYITNGFKVRNIKITGADVKGVSTVGLLAGEIANGASVLDTEVQGEITANPTAALYFETWNSTYYGRIISPEYIGGMAGVVNGTGSVHLNNKVDVDINIYDDANYAAELANDSYSPQYSDSIYSIGGYVGDVRQEKSKFAYLDVDSKIRIVASNGIKEIGGLVGYSKSEFTNSKVNTDIHISFVQFFGQQPEYQIVQDIGGTYGTAKDLSTSFCDVTSKIVIDRATANNNPWGIVADFNDELNVDVVGGGGGYADEGASDVFNSVKTEIEIKDAANVSMVGGYVGQHDASYTIGKTDIFVSGSLSVDASETISWFSGFANLESDGAISGTRLFTAVEMETSGSATVTKTDPFAYVDKPERQYIVDSYWDSSLNRMPASGDISAKPATTSQLQNSSFLKATGMNLSNFWKLENGEYPVLLDGAYTYRLGGETVYSPIISGPEVLIPRDVILPETAKSKSQVIVRGAFLNTVTGVTLDGKDVDYTVKTDGTLTFDVPAIGVGKYQVTIRSQRSGSVVYKQLEVVPNVQVKALKGKIRIKAFGLLGKTVNWKVGKVKGNRFVANNLTLIDVPTAVKGKKVRVTFTIEGVKYSTELVTAK